MGLLATFFLGWFSTFASAFATQITRRWAIALAVSTVLITITAAFFIAMKAMVVALQATLPTELLIVAGAFIPSNAMGCVATYGAARLVYWAYHFNRDLIGYYMTA